MSEIFISFKSLPFVFYYIAKHFAKKSSLKPYIIANW